MYPDTFLRGEVPSEANNVSNDVLSDQYPTEVIAAVSGQYPTEAIAAVSSLDPTEAITADTHETLETALHVLDEMERLKVIKKIAKAFLRTKYPVSAKGKMLQKEIHELFNSENGEGLGLQVLENLLPTVEDPHLDLFEDLIIPPEQDAGVLGWSQSNIQVTKGCSHKCSFCAASAGSKLQIMPFAAVLKIAERKRSYDQQFETEWQRLQTIAASREGTSITIHENDFPHQFDSFGGVFQSKKMEALVRLRCELFNYVSAFLNLRRFDSFDKREECLSATIDKIFSGLEVSADQHGPSRKYREEAVALIEQIPLLERRTELQRVYQALKDYPSKEQQLSENKLLSLEKSDFIRPLHNYYDSDPFDYCDATFLHKNGLPADYGDVVDVLATPTRKVLISAAGFKIPNLKDGSWNAAYNAAKKIAGNKNVILRISVNGTEAAARKNPAQYLERMKQVISLLAPVVSQVMIFSSYGTDDNDFLPIVADPLTAFIEDNYPHVPHDFTIVSTFSAREGFLKKKEEAGNMYENVDSIDSIVFENFDVMAFSPGIHILPDGKVSRQDCDKFGEVPSGSRPLDTGKRVFELAVSSDETKTD